VIAALVDSLKVQKALQHLNMIRTTRAKVAITLFTHQNLKTVMILA
jgi:hypothetical protein